MKKDKAKETKAVPEALSWWRVPIICRGINADNISVQVPMWDSERYNNRIFLLYHKDAPPELFAVIKNGMTFHAEVPMICHTQAEFRVRKVEIPNVAGSGKTE